MDSIFLTLDVNIRFVVSSFSECGVEKWLTLSEATSVAYHLESSHTDECRIYQRLNPKKKKTDEKKKK